MATNVTKHTTAVKEGIASAAIMCNQKPGEILNNIEVCFG
jgi:hypothetical protein